MTLSDLLCAIGAALIAAALAVLGMTVFSPATLIDDAVGIAICASMAVGAVTVLVRLRKRKRAAL